MDQNRLERFLSFLQELTHEACLPLSNSRKRYPVDQEVILECVYYGTLLYEALSKETVMMEETDFHHPIEEERARMLCEGTPFFCEKMNEILERKTLEKNQFDLCLCPDFIPLRRRIEDWFSEVETN